MTLYPRKAEDEDNPNAELPISVIRLAGKNEKWMWGLPNDTPYTWGFDSEAEALAAAREELSDE
jgi:hypothetical protein